MKAPRHIPDAPMRSTLHFPFLAGFVALLLVALLSAVADDAQAATSLQAHAAELTHASHVEVPNTPAEPSGANVFRALALALGAVGVGVVAGTSSRTAYTVKTLFRLNGKWRMTGDTVHLTAEEYDVYKGFLDGPDFDPSAHHAYLPGQEPQERTPVDPLTVAQAEAGDPVAAEDVVGRQTTAAEGRADVTDGGTYETREMTAGKAATAASRTRKPKGNAK